MTIVKVLVDAVGEYNAGDIVTDAPDGLVEIAKKKICNAASGELLAVIIESDEVISENPSNRELELQSELQQSKEREEVLQEQLDALIAENTLRDLKANAKELKISGYTKMSADELMAAIAAAGGGSVAE
ncbi:Rho termination factor N-terminal domain-containing protein [Paenibacillus sp. NRS-1760]|uniref:Rho termination factor N-terminal domain-containing protein n=1 Tax=Paenibacillus sp. NRS-1760 TaxID=3233902 RepID=UPI003D28C232